MDAFRLLSRSTKLTKTSLARKTRHESDLPSAGRPVNPQLFGNETDISPSRESPDNQPRGMKRKRSKGSVAPTASTAHSLSGEVSGDGIEQHDQQPMSLDKRRLILKSHKVKIIRLDGHNSKPSQTSTGKSKKQKPHSEKLVELFPEPLTSFHELSTRYSISKRLLENVMNEGYTVPTEVQLGCLPLLLTQSRFEGREMKEKEDIGGKLEPDGMIDLLTVAPTGSGKTLAYLIPVLNEILRLNQKVVGGKSIKLKREHILRAIIVAPTKELAFQIVNEGKKLASQTGIKITGLRKGLKLQALDPEHRASHAENGDINAFLPESENQGADDERNDMAAKTDVLVTTPLLLVHELLNKGSRVSTLSTVEYLILDEADVLLDPLFRGQTMSIWDACDNPNLHISLWSATMGASIEELVLSKLKDRNSRSQHPQGNVPLLRLVVGLKDSAIPNVSHKLVYTASEAGKLLALRQLLHPTPTSAETIAPLRPPFLVFTQTIPRAVALHSELLYDIPLEAGGSSRIAVLHSDLSDSRRQEVMTRFRKGEVWVLITTDLLSRGVDFRGVNGVVNYDIPTSAAAYVHRAGRTGRGGRQGGVAVTLYTKDDIPYIKSVANIIAAAQKQGGISDPKETLQPWLLDAIPQLNKNQKKELKRRGVEVRRAGTGSHGKGDERSRISTKSGFQRRLEHKRRGRAEGTAKTPSKTKRGSIVHEATEEWDGFD